MQFEKRPFVYAVRVQVLAVLAGTMLGGTVSAQAAGLVPHRAVYDMELADTGKVAGIAGLTGRMVYDFSGSACEGYSINFRFVTAFQGKEGGSQVTDLQTSSYESGNGESFQFLSKTFVDQRKVEATRGTAETNGEGKSIVLQEPKERTFQIDGSAIFPTVHLRKIIEAAKAEQHFLTADVFDGSETGDKVYATTAVIGAGHMEPLKGAEEPGTVVKELPRVTYWPVTIAYFDPTEEKSGEELPAYRLSFLLYENGISRQMVLDYGEFAIKGTLSDLKLYDETPCTN